MLDTGKDNEQKIQWHQAFVGAMHCELGEDRDKLIFEQEYSITKKPLQIDLLIIKKRAEDEFKSKLGRMLSSYTGIQVAGGFPWDRCAFSGTYLCVLLQEQRRT